MRKWFIFVAILIFIATAFLFSTYDFSSPRYQGRPLIDWIRPAYLKWDREVYDSPNTANLSVPEIQQSTEAIRSVGTNAIPYYLHLLKTPDDSRAKAVISDWLAEHISSSLGDRLAHWVYSQDIVRSCGAWGLTVLGPSAKSAIPELARFLNSCPDDQAGNLAAILSSLGPDGIPALANCLANPSSYRRTAAVAGLHSYTRKMQYPPWRTNSEAEVESAARIIVPLMIPLLTDNDDSVRVRAARVIVTAPISVEVSAKRFVTALNGKTAIIAGGQRLINLLLNTVQNQPNAIAILQQISADTNSAYSSQAAAILQRVHDDSLKISKK